jgi:hypothetical protein
MALLNSTTVTGVTTQTAAAYLPVHLVRLGELQSLLAGYQQAGSGVSPAQITGLTSFIDAAVASLIENTSSIAWISNSGAPSLMASVVLAPNGAIGVNSQGLYVQLGSGANQVMPGNAVPSGLPILPVTLMNGGTVSLGPFNGRQIPAQFQGGTPIQSADFEVIALTQGGVLTTPSGVQADFGPGYSQVARGADVLALIAAFNTLEQSQPTAVSTDSISLSLISSAGLPAGATFPVLFERAGEVMPLDSVGGQYELDCPVQVNRVGVKALAAPVNTVFELLVGGVGTGITVVAPSGLPNTSVVGVTNPVTPETQILLTGNGRTLPITWQCISGSSSPATAISQVDLVMYVIALASETIGNRLSATLNLEPGGALQTTGSGVGVIYGNFVAETSPAGTVAPGFHTHQFPELTAYSTDSLTLMISAEQLSGAVNVDPDPPDGYGMIAVDANGLAVVLGLTSDTAAAGNHTHQAVSQSGSGFMTPAMLMQLDAAAGLVGYLVNYFRTSHCPVGGYVGGGYRWPQRMQVIGVNVVTQTPPQYNQVLSLVVGGVQQALQITIPSGVVNAGGDADVFVSLDDLTGVFIPMESSSGVWTSYARWLCTSGTGPLYDLAAEITVAMNVVPY